MVGSSARSSAESPSPTPIACGSEGPLPPLNRGRARRAAPQPQQDDESHRFAMPKDFLRDAKDAYDVVVIGSDWPG